MTDDIAIQRLLYASAARITRIQEDTLAALPMPLTGRQYRVLARIGSGKTSPTELARLARRSLPTVSESIELLVRRGLLERTTSPTDRRASILALTPTGELALKEADRQVNSIADQLLSAVPAQSHTELAEHLQALLSAAEEMLDQNKATGAAKK